MIPDQAAAEQALRTRLDIILHAPAAFDDYSFIARLEAGPISPQNAAYFSHFYARWVMLLARPLPRLRWPPAPGEEYLAIDIGRLKYLTDGRRC